MRIIYLLFFISSFGSSIAQKTGKILYEQRCNFCHNGNLKEAPTLSSLNLLSQSSIVNALTSGVMKQQAAGLSTKEIESIAAFLSKKNTQEKELAQKNSSDSFSFANETAIVTNWGMDLHNTRYSSENIEINVKNVSKLALKWAFAFPNATRARAQPTLTESYVFTADQNGIVYALDRQTGKQLWTFQAEAEVRSAIVIGKNKDGYADKIYFGDFKANIYAIDLSKQKLLWKRKVDEHVAALITGTPTLYKDILYVPISSLEVGYAMNPAYECCTFRGSIAALNIETGEQIWKTYMVDEATSVNTKGPKYGPSGAPVWSSPTIDEPRGQIYFGTGENYSHPTSTTSDAIIAVDMTTGKINWVRQVTQNDAWNGSCPGNINCPENYGPDYDFGAPPILIKRKNEADILVAGQKSGMVFGINPDNGTEIWHTRVGRGGIMGGIHWGMATNGKQLFVPINDQSVYDADKNKPTKAGLHALDISTGEILWSKLEENRCPVDLDWNCYPGLSAAITAIPGLIFGGALDGVVHGYDDITGDVLWGFDTNIDFTSVNGVTAFGGSIDSSGPVIAGSQMYINSGYAKFGEKAGNVILCFELKDQ
jgi:polyvinyl alcohol dehydrogenase (cytochrome)